jgi:hypothetical protein
MTCLGGRARSRSASAQRPAFAERGAVADLSCNAEAVLIHLHPQGVRSVVIEGLIVGIVRSEHGPRFTRGEDITVHVTLGHQMLARSKDFLKRLAPVPHWLTVYLHDDMPDQRWSDSLVGQSKVDVGRVAAVEFEDWPNRCAHLLALHVGGVTRNTQSQKSNEGRNDCVVSAGAAPLLLLRHDADHIASGVSVNQPAPL